MCYKPKNLLFSVYPSVLVLKTRHNLASNIVKGFTLLTKPPGKPLRHYITASRRNDLASNEPG
jgi:hypothetical protein